jgi:hypothetical protein
LQFFVRVVKSFLSAEVRWRALTLFAVLVGLLFAISGLIVLNSFVGRDFMTAISHRDQAGFVRMAAHRGPADPQPLRDLRVAQPLGLWSEGPTARSTDPASMSTS